MADEPEPAGAGTSGGGNRVGSYEIIGAPLAKGGSQGRIFRARCLVSSGSLEEGTEVALKEMLLPFEGERLLARARRTVETLRDNPHAGIVRYFDFFVWQPGTFSERQCVIMELLRGGTLAEKIAGHPRGLEWEEVRAIFAACLDALRHARSLGIIHRDLKPSNIFLPDTGEPAKLIDFEIARHETETQSTHTGLHGSFDYMAPEFHPRNLPHKGFSGDEISDIYSLTVCLYEALAGRLPYEAERGGGHQGFFERAESDQNRKLLLSRRKLRPLVGIREFLEKGLAFEREKRFGSFEEMAQCFERIRRELVPDGKEGYELLTWIGRGGFADVFQARRISDRAEVALKCLRRDRYAPLFLKEARMLQDCSHPNVVRAYDLFRMEAVERYFLVLEYLPNMPEDSLHGRLREAKDGLPVEEVVALFVRYAHALDALHKEHGIIHRDIKPSNLYAPKGHPENAKLLDLGIARDTTGTVSVGPVPGTFDYMAPEFGYDRKARGSPQTDLFSLGMCLYRALTGRPVYPPLPRSPVGSTIAAFLERSRNPLDPDLGHPVFLEFPALPAVIRKTLDPDPRKRFGDMAAFAEALGEVLAPAPLRIEQEEDAGATTSADWGDPEEGATEATLAVPHEAGTQATVAYTGGPSVATQATRAAAAPGSGPRRVWRKIPKALVFSLATLLALLLAGGAAWGVLWWRATSLHAEVQETGDRELSEGIEATGSAVAWLERFGWSERVGIRLAELKTEVEQSRDRLGKRIEELGQREPLRTWSERLHQADTLLLIPASRVALGKKAHGDLQRRIAKARGEFEGLRGTVVAAVPSSWPEDEASPVVFLRRGEQLVPSKVDGKNFNFEVQPDTWEAVLQRPGFAEIVVSVEVGPEQTTDLAIPAPEKWVKAAWLLALEKAEAALEAGSFAEASRHLDGLDENVIVGGDYRDRFREAKKAVETWTHDQLVHESAITRMKEAGERALGLVGSAAHAVEDRDLQAIPAALVAAQSFLTQNEGGIEGEEEVRSRLNKAVESAVRFLESEIGSESDLARLDKLTGAIQSMSRDGLGSEEEWKKLENQIAKRRDGFVRDGFQREAENQLKAFNESFNQPFEQRLVLLDEALAYVDGNADDLKDPESYRKRIQSARERLVREEAARLAEVYRALDATTSLGERIAALASWASFLQSVSENEELAAEANALDAARDDVADGIRQRMKVVDAERATTLKEIDDTLRDTGESVLGPNRQESLLKDLEQARRTFVWRFDHSGTRTVTVRLGKIEKTVAPGGFAEFEVEVEGATATLQAEVSSSLDGYQPIRRAINAIPGGYAREFFDGEFVALPVRLEVKDGEADRVVVFVEEEWVDLAVAPKEVPVGTEVRVRWERDDHEPIERSGEAAAGAPVSFAAPEPAHWKPTRELVALRDAETAMREGNNETAKELLPARQMQGKEMEALRLEIGSLIEARDAFARGDLDQALIILAKRTPEDSTPFDDAWNSLREQVEARIWKIADPTSNRRVLEGATADSWRKERQPPKDSLPAAHQMFRTLAVYEGVGWHGQVLNALFKEGHRLDAQDLALALFCEWKGRQRLQLIDERAPSFSTLSMVGDHAAKLDLLLAAVKAADASTQQELVALLAEWKEQEPATDILAMLRGEPVSGSDPYAIFRKYREFNPAALNPRSKEAAENHLASIQGVLERKAPLSGFAASQ